LTEVLAERRDRCGAGIALCEGVSMKRILVLALAALALAAIGGSMAGAAGHDSVVVPLRGKSLGEMGARWWEWVLAIPASQNPIFDQT